MPKIEVWRASSQSSAWLFRNHNTFQLRSQDPFSSFLMKEL